MSDPERFARVAQRKWANERFAQKILAKKSKILFFSMFYIRFFILKNERFAHSLFFNERCEQIAQVAHQKWAMWANRSGLSPKMKNERMSELRIFLSELLIRSFFLPKASSSLRKPMSEFPALVICKHVCYCNTTKYFGCKVGGHYGVGGRNKPIPYI